MSDSRPLVVFVDDDAFFANIFRVELETDFRVEHYKEPSLGLDRIEADPKWDCLILDVMMPFDFPGEEEVEGEETGLWMLEKIAGLVKERECPVLILTNRDLDYVRARISEMMFQKGLVTAIAKKETEPQRLRKLIGAAMNLGSAREAAGGYPRGDNSGKTVLLIATEWESRHGGLSTFNRELAGALSRLGHSVHCYLPFASRDESLAASSEGITLVFDQSAVDLSGEFGDAILLRRPPLRDGTVPDLIIGHDRHTGKYAYHLRKDFFPEARLVQFIHTAPGEIEWHKPPMGEPSRGLRAEAKMAEQKSICDSADFVCAVGPRLHREVSHLLYSSPHAESVIEFIPGLSEANEIYPKRVPPLIQCLVLGRGEDFELKGIDIAATALGSVARSGIVDGEVELVVRGSPKDQVDELRERLVQLGGEDLRVATKAYSENIEMIREDIRRASVLLMPSRSEGFGLVGLEAISCGVPVLVSAKSGLAELLCEAGGEECRRVVVEVSDDIVRTAANWEREIEFILRDRNASLVRAKTLRDELKKSVSWDESARALVDSVFSH